MSRRKSAAIARTIATPARHPSLASLKSRENAIPAFGFVHAGQYVARAVKSSGLAVGRKISFVNKQ